MIKREKLFEDETVNIVECGRCGRGRR